MRAMKYEDEDEDEDEAKAKAKANDDDDDEDGIGTQMAELIIRDQISCLGHQIGGNRH